MQIYAHTDIYIYIYIHAFIEYLPTYLSTWVTYLHACTHAYIHTHAHICTWWEKERGRERERHRERERYIYISLSYIYIYIQITMVLSSMPPLFWAPYLGSDKKLKDYFERLFPDGTIERVYIVPGRRGTRVNLPFGSYGGTRGYLGEQWLPSSTKSPIFLLLVSFIMCSSVCYSCNAFFLQLTNPNPTTKPSRNLLKSGRKHRICFDVFILSWIFRFIICSVIFHL